MKTPLALAAGALMLVWPALLNGYPLVFSDTGGLLAMALEADSGWDKPWAYGPFLLALHGRTTLWVPALAQGLLLSHLLWLTQKAFVPRWDRVRRPASRHLALCAGSAAATAAPWFAALLMPDIFAPVVVLCTALLGVGRARLTRWEQGWVAALGVLAVAVHLAHLVLAAGCLCAVWLLRPGPLRRRLAWRPAVPLAGALCVLVAGNALIHGVPGVSPYGSVFMLARLVADGPARELIERDCPAAGHERMCAWKGRLPADSDAFLWDESGPVWGDNRGPVAFAPEASRVVRDTVLAYPGAVAAAMAANTWRQLWKLRVGDALVPDHLDGNVRLRLSAHFPPEEVARYDASVQRAGGLPGVAARFAPLHGAVLALGALGSVGVLMRCWRRERALSALAGVVLAGLAANAFATGALSGPHDRYQARIAWLVVLPPALAAMRPRYAASPATSSGAMRTRAS